MKGIPGKQKIDVVCYNSVGALHLGSTKECPGPDHIECQASLSRRPTGISIENLSGGPLKGEKDPSE